MTTHLLTTATHSSGYYPVLIESCKRHNINLQVLGLGKKWDGFTWKFKIMKDHLNLLNDKDICIFVDAFDVIVLKDLSEITNRFLKYNTPILLSRDSKITNIIRKYLYNKCFKSCRGTNINSGCYMGYVWALKIMFSKIFEKYEQTRENDDQVLMIDICNDPFFDNYIKMDMNRSIFLNILCQNILSDNLVITLDKNNKLINEYGIEPCIVHAPGNGDMKEIIKAYTFQNIQKESFVNGSLSKVPLYIRFFGNEIVVLIIIIVLLIK
jgi:hypothetical protein